MSNEVALIVSGTLNIVLIVGLVVIVIVACCVVVRTQSKAEEAMSLMNQPSVVIQPRETLRASRRLQHHKWMKGQWKEYEVPMKDEEPMEVEVQQPSEEPMEVQDPTERHVRWQETVRIAQENNPTPTLETAL